MAPNRTTIPWDAWVADYSKIRDAIAATVRTELNHQSLFSSRAGAFPYSKTINGPPPEPSLPAVGVAAIFHFLALRYGVDIAFAIVGGLFLVLGLIGFLSGFGRMKRALPPMPRPFGELEALKRTAALDLLAKTDQVKHLARDHSTSMLFRVGFESHEARAIRRASSMTDAT